MGRAPYCQKMGLRKGPWSVEEDRILIAHIQKYGHPNWCALPKVAGLLRCGRSCRLRWLNYLKPDIKRGNFSKEEEEAIINLHKMLGNRWSAIAARLPGRTDNEIKNMWHTQLKKRAALKQTMANSDDKQNSKKITHQFAESAVLSPQPYSSDFSSVTASSTGETNHYHQSTDVKDKQNFELFDHFPEIDECFWTDAISEFAIDDGMDFWYNILLTTGGEPT